MVTAIDFSILEMYKVLSLIQMILRDMNDIPLGHFLWKNIPENLVNSEEIEKKMKNPAFNYYIKPLPGEESPEIELPFTTFPGNKVYLPTPTHRTQSVRESSKSFSFIFNFKYFIYSSLHFSITI